jgi:hypothetical protein
MIQDAIIHERLPNSSKIYTSSWWRVLNSLLTYPQLGVLLEEFAPRDVRHVSVGDCELRYEVTQNLIYILRLWHTREDC